VTGRLPGELRSLTYREWYAAARHQFEAFMDGRDRRYLRGVEQAGVTGRGPAQAGGKPAATTVATGPRCRVLLVEDRADTRLMLNALLGGFGCEVTVAGSGREALARADRQSFDLLLSDIGLPDGSGLDVMRHMQVRQKIRGIALSGFGQDDDLRRSREAWFERHLTKPVNLKTLRDIILHDTA
jgi:CheY-like chemotaxis protein